MIIDCDYSIYDQLRKTIRYAIRNYRHALSWVNNSRQGNTSSQQYYQDQLNTVYNGFDLEQRPEQKRFWQRVEDEIEVHKVKVDLVNLMLVTEQVKTLKDFAPKRISPIH